MDTLRAATDISPWHHAAPGPREFSRPFSPAFRGRRAPPPDHYRANAYSIMSDTPKAAPEIRKMQACAEFWDLELAWNLSRPEPRAGLEPESAWNPSRPGTRAG